MPNLKVKDFTIMVEDLITELKNNPKLSDKKYSDIVDANGNQYVDLVMEGGGVLGVALVGYVYVLEQMGIRFLQLGGTSAGAINTMLMAIGPIDKPKSEWILEKLANKDFSEFEDGDYKLSKKLKNEENLSHNNKCEEIINKERWFKRNKKSIKSLFKIFKIYSNSKDKLGLNSGKAFTGWLKGILDNEDASSISKLYTKRKITGLKNSIDKIEVDSCRYNNICIISTDITTETKVKFPEMAKMYWKEPNKVHPADFVRASMSIPLFFEPFTVSSSDLPKDIDTIKEWEEKYNYTGCIPDNVRFVDGGMVSNFPIDAFHKDDNKMPTAPTFGVKLQLERNKPNKSNDLGSMAMSILDTSRHIYDYQFIQKHPDFKQLVSYVDTGNIDWLNFNMGDEDKKNLFLYGAQAAKEFLEQFDWEAYKAIRKEILESKYDTQQQVAFVV